jgi:hypothetical protein
MGYWYTMKIVKLTYEFGQPEWKRSPKKGFMLSFIAGNKSLQSKYITVCPYVRFESEKCCMYVDLLNYPTAFGAVFCAVSVRSRKLCNISHRMGNQNLLFSAPCFRRHVKLLILAAFAVVSTHSSFMKG